MISTDYADIARQTGKAESTVKSVIERCKDLPEYVEVRQKMKILFSEDFLRITKKALKRLEATIDNPESNIMVHHLTTVIGTLIDKLRLIHGVDASEEDEDEGGIIQINQVQELTPPEVD
jgi:di/tripeptidase